MVPWPAVHSHTLCKKSFAWARGAFCLAQGEASARQSNGLAAAAVGRLHCHVPKQFHRLQLVPVTTKQRCAVR